MVSRKLILIYFAPLFLVLHEAADQTIRPATAEETFLTNCPKIFTNFFKVLLKRVENYPTGDYSKGQVGIIATLSLFILLFCLHPKYDQL